MENGWAVLRFAGMANEEVVAERSTYDEAHQVLQEENDYDQYMDIVKIVDGKHTTEF